MTDIRWYQEKALASLTLYSYHFRALFLILWLAKIGLSRGPCICLIFVQIWLLLESLQNVLYYLAMVGYQNVAKYYQSLQTLNRLLV